MKKVEGVNLPPMPGLEVSGRLDIPVSLLLKEDGQVRKLYIHEQVATRHYNITFYLMFVRL
jgi:hypothetical protein